MMPLPYLKTERAWINQPSDFDTHHHLHGLQGVAVNWKEGNAVCYSIPLIGAVYSMQIPTRCLSKGKQSGY